MNPKAVRASQSLFRSQSMPRSSHFPPLSDSNIQGQSSSSQGNKRSRSYITWNKEMDALFADVLYDQLAQGNKSEGDWKPQAYQAVVDALNAKLGLNLVIGNVKNRMKAWKRHYAVVTDIQTRTKFKWDDERKMVVITLEDTIKWNEYIKTFSEAHGYQNKVIENWDDIIVLCSNDRATGEGAETFQEAAEAMDGEMNEVESTINLDEETSRTADKSSTKNKKVKKDQLADAVMEIADSFKNYLASKKNSERAKPTGEEIYQVVSQINGLQKVEIFQPFAS